MKITLLSKKRFETLEPFVLAREIHNTEGQLFYLPQKNKWATEMKLLKKFFVAEGDTFGNKLYTINSLITHSTTIEMPEIIYPETFAAVKDKIVGFTMPLVLSENLQIILNDKTVDNKRKIKYLGEIGTILEKMKFIRKYRNLPDFFLNDMHEGNFIVNSETDRVNIVDSDSMKIAGNNPCPSKYFTNKNLRMFPNKYSLDENLDVLPNEQSDLYCYAIIILNFLLKDDIRDMSVEEFFVYIEYLSSLGISKELIDILASIYENKKNANPYEHLETLTVEQMARASYFVYYKLKRKNENSLNDSDVKIYTPGKSA